MTTFSTPIGTAARSLAVLLLVLTALTGRAAPLPPGQTLYDVTFGGGTFVAVGANGTIFSSVNSGAWTLRAAVVTNDLRAVGFGGGVFVAAGANGILLSSPDGVAWTVRSVTAVLSSPDIAYGNGRFVVGGKGPTGFWTLLASTNGADWESTHVEAPVAPFAPEGIPFGGVTFGAGRFLAVGGTYAGSQTLVSPNGLEWKEQGNEGESRAIVGPVTFGNGRFTAVSEWYDDDDDDGGPRHSLALSENGSRWAITSGSVPYGRQSIIAADCATVIASAYPYFAGSPSQVLYSYDQLNWTAVPGIISSINALAFGNGTFVGVGSDILPLAITRPTNFFSIQPASYSLSINSFNSYFYFQSGTPCLDPPVRYQWQVNGIDIPNATNLTYYSSITSTNQAGNYTVVAFNASGSITSASAAVTVTVPPAEAPTFYSPVGDTTNGYVAGQDTSLSVGVNGWPAPDYRWRFNGTEIPGATNSYLTLWNIGANATGQYTVQASNALGVALSAVQTLILNPGDPPDPSFSEAGFAVTEGSRVVLPFSFYYPYIPSTYSVLKNGVDIHWPVAAFPSFALRQVKQSDAGQYAFVSSNPSGRVTNHVLNLTVTPGGALDRWAQRNPLPQNDALLKVTHADGRFMAVGERGAVVSSLDGTNWSSQHLPTEINLFGVARDGSRWLAAGENSFLASLDGANWSAVFNRSDLSLQAVVVANGRIVAAGGQNILAYTDGLGWQEAILSPTANRQLRGVAVGNGRWVAVGAFIQGYYRPMWTSANGIQWEPVSGMSADFESVIFAGDQFLAVGDEGAIFTSIDGITWVRRNSRVSNRLIDAAYGNGKYIVVGTRGRILSSPSTATWTTENSGTPDRLESVTFGNGLFVAVGENGTTLTSANGTSWLKRSQGTTRDLDGIAVGNGLVTIAGKGGTVLTSINGSNFVERSTGVTNDLHGISWGNGLHVAVGEPGAILTSANATQWTVRPSGSSSSLKSVACGGDRWVAVGTQGEILTSTDGTEWVQRFSPTANDLNGVAYGNGLFVAVGDNLPPNGTMLTSPDGLTWTRRNQYLGKNLRSVTFANGIFLATANDGMIMVSTNGLLWEPRFTGYQGNQFSNLRSATYANGLWTLTGNFGFILTSADTFNWIRHIPQTTENLHGIVHHNGRFVAIGNRGIVLQSDYFDRAATLAAFKLPSGVGLTLTGEPGLTYRVEATDQLPASQWLTIGTFTLSQPTTNFLNTTTIGFQKRFYRAVSP